MIVLRIDVVYSNIALSWVSRFLEIMTKSFSPVKRQRLLHTVVAALIMTLGWAGVPSHP